MKSGQAVLPTAKTPDQGHEGLGYPRRVIIVFATVLALAVIWLMLPFSRELVWSLTVILCLVTLTLIGFYTRKLAHIRQQSAHVLDALGTATSNIPVKLRTRMPLVLVTGDGLAALFDQAHETRHAHVGDGGIWLRIDRTQDLPRIAVAVRQWRDGRAPDGVVLSVAPALYANTDALTQSLRLTRQAVADATRMLGTRLPGYIAVYQRLTTGPAALSTPRWYGIASATRLVNTDRFASVIRAAEDEIQQVVDNHTTSIRAAALASLIGWTRHIVLGALTDPQQPAAPWPLFGAGWIDCGPASAAGGPWEYSIEMQTGVIRAAAAASPLPWPLPQPLLEAMPRRAWMSPRTKAFAHALALLACAATVSFWGAAKNNQALLTRIGNDLDRYTMIPTRYTAAKRDALQALIADRDQLKQYAHTGVPLRLSFGMYRGAPLLPLLDKVINAYVAPPAIVTLDSMSLFDSGRAQLKPGSTRAMVGALEMIKAHPKKRILIAGHTDNTGHSNNNLKLSTARAQAVRDWLMDASGIPATQFAIQGYGDTRPIASNNTPDEHARNRRVEITLIPDVEAPEKQQ